MTAPPSVRPPLSPDSTVAPTVRRRRSPLPGARHTPSATTSHSLLAPSSSSTHRALRACLLLIAAATASVLAGTARRAGALYFPTKAWERTNFTLDEFPVAGVNLAAYGMANARKELADGGSPAAAAEADPFELYDDFDISHLITGNEGWWDLVGYRKELARPTLSFYVDKVAQKRWLPVVRGMPIPEPFALRYRSELTESGEYDDEWDAVHELLPTNVSYAAKPTHKSCSSGVWLVSQREGRTPRVAEKGHYLERVEGFGGKRVAESLADDLRKTAGSFESWALLNVKPGVMVEERFVTHDSKHHPAIEFKVFTIWGRVWLANWRRGHKRFGLVYRNGTVVNWSGFKEDHAALPDWVDWPRVIKIAEELGEHKDMYRTDIFVGVGADSPTLAKGRSDEERRAAIRVVVSETEIHPTTTLRDPGLFEEAARLWIAGYMVGRYRVVPNDEVPEVFQGSGMLTEGDALKIRTERALQE